MKKKILFGLSALLLVGAASVGSFATSVSATEVASGWAGYTSTATAVTDGIKITNIGGLGQRAWRKEKLHIDGLEFDYVLGGMPQGLSSSNQTCEGFYFHFNEQPSTYYSEGPVCCFGWWVSSQWASQTRMWVSTSQGCGDYGGGTNLIYGDTDKTKVGWSGTASAAIMSLTAGANDYSTHFKFEKYNDNFYKVTMNKPTNVSGWTIGHYNYTSGNAAIFGYIEASKIADANGDAYLAVYGGNEYGRAGGEVIRHFQTFTKIEDGKVGTWATNFLSGTDTDCAAGDIEASLTTNWNSYKTAFNTLSPASKLFFKGYAADQEGTDTAKAKARYNQVVNKYGLEDFAGTVSTSTNYINLTDNNSYVAIAIAAGVVACAAIVLFFDKRKKVTE